METDQSPKEQEVKENILRFKLMTEAVEDVLRDIKRIPSGHLYVHLMEYMSLETYDRILNVLKQAGKLTETSDHMLHWKENKTS